MSAGIRNKDAEVRYLRYCEEYNSAWVEFLPEIIETVEKFDGKKVTKRIDTAIRKIDSRLYLTIEKDGYDNGGYVYLKWFDYDGRIFKDEETGEWDYVQPVYGGCDFIEMFRVNDMECFDAQKFISRLETDADRDLKHKEESFNALDNLDELKKDYNEKLEAFAQARSNIPSNILKYYSVGEVQRWR